MQLEPLNPGRSSAAQPIHVRSCFGQLNLIHFCTYQSLHPTLRKLSLADIVAIGLLTEEERLQLVPECRQRHVVVSWLAAAVGPCCRSGSCLSWQAW